MKTTIDIPDSIMEDSMKITRKPTKKEAVVTAMTEFVRRKKLELLADQLGSFDGIFSNEELNKLRDES